MDDLISRQAAIEAIRNIKAIKGTSDDKILLIDKAEAQTELMMLPSAQPEPIKINIDDFNKEDLERFKKELGNTPITVLPAQPEIIRCKDCKHKHVENMVWTCPFGLPGGENFFCGYGTEPYKGEQ